MEQKKSATKENILHAATELFSMVGYKATTVRMIAEKADANVASISFYFGSKEGLYRAVIDKSASTMESHFDIFDSKVDHYLSGNTYQEQTWAYIEEFVALIINVAKDNSKFPLLHLITHEQMSANNGEFPLTEVVYKKSERMLVDLVMNLLPNGKKRQIKICCRLIIGGIMAQAENPLFLKMAVSSDDGGELNEETWQDIFKLTIFNIKSMVKLLEKDE